MKPCDVIINCPCSGSPLMGVDAMAPDPPEFVATGYEAVVPALGNSTWTRLECMQFAESTVNEADAQATANRNALLCALGALSPYIQPSGSSGGGGGGATVFFSNEASCTVNCPDGLPFIYTVAAGAFVSNSSQNDADAKAQSSACAQAAQRAICLSALSPATYAVNAPYNGSISATGGFSGDANTWQVTSGTLPPGLTLTGSGSTANISGTPTVGGVYTFNVTVTDSLGDTMTKTYTLACTTSYTIVLNYFQDPYVGPPPGLRTLGFQTGTPPDPGYDTRYDSLNSACFNRSSTFEANFTSGTPKTWNLKVVMNLGANPSQPLYSVLFNGVVQSGWVVSGNIATLITSFNTNNCTNTDVLITGQGSQSCISIMFEWLTPP